MVIVSRAPLVVAAFLFFLAWVTHGARACSIRALPPPPTVPFKLSAAAPVMAVSGYGRAVGTPDEIDIELAVLPEPFKWFYTCAQFPTGAGGADRSLELAELDAAVSKIVNAGIDARAIRARLILPQPSPWDPDRVPKNKIGQIEIAVQPPFVENISAALRRVGSVLNAYQQNWRDVPIKIVNLSWRERNCDTLHLAVEARSDDAWRNAIDAAIAMGYSNVTALPAGVWAPGKDVEGTYACGSGFGSLTYSPQTEPDLDSIAAGEHWRWALPPMPDDDRVAVVAGGGGVFSLQGSLVDRAPEIPTAMASTTVPMRWPGYIDHSIVVPGSISFVAALATYSVIVPKTYKTLGVDPAIRSAVLAHAMRYARARATAMAHAANGRLGRFLGVNVAREDIESATCCDVLFSSYDGDRMLVRQTIAAAWELAGTKSRAARARSLTDLSSYESYGSNSNVHSAFRTIDAIGSVTGTGRHPLVRGEISANCRDEAMSALSDAVRDGLAKTGGSVRALIDAGDGFATFDTTCAPQMRPFSSAPSYDDRSDVVQEDVLVVP